MRQRHLAHGVAEEKPDVRVPELQERLVRGRVRHHKRRHRGKQHGTGGLRGRMRQVDKLLPAMLVPLNLFDVNAIIVHVLP